MTPLQLVVAYSIAGIAAATVFGCLWVLGYRWYERQRARRVRAYTVIAGRVSLFETRIPRPHGASVGDEWGQHNGVKWIVNRWDGERWTFERYA